MEKKTQLDKSTVEATESPESIIARLTEENRQLKVLAEKSINENQILRATVKALSQLI